MSGAGIRRSRRLLLLAPLLAACGEAAPGEGTSGDVRGVEQRIAYFERVVAEDPAHWPALAHLGAAWLERARETCAPGDLARARDLLERSLEVQPNLEALKARAALANFGHRFEEALAWSDRVAAAAEHPSEAVALRVEALLGLGREEEARDVLEEASGGPESFPLLAARAQLQVLAGRTDDAVATLERAAGLAARSEVEELQAWCLVRCAGILVEAGRVEEAEPFLDLAGEVDPGSTFLLRQRALALEAEGRDVEALEQYRELLTIADNPNVHARAAALCRRLGREAEALRHTRAAEEGLRAVLEAGGEDATASLRLDLGTLEPASGG